MPSGYTLLSSPIPPSLLVPPSLFFLLLGIFLSRFFLTKFQSQCVFCYPTFVMQYSLLLLEGYIFLPTFIKSASDNCSLFLLCCSINVLCHITNKILYCHVNEQKPENHTHLPPCILLIIIITATVYFLCKVYFTSLGTSSVNIKKVVYK